LTALESRAKKIERSHQGERGGGGFSPGKKVWVKIEAVTQSPKVSKRRRDGRAPSSKKEAKRAILLSKGEKKVLRVWGTMGQARSGGGVSRKKIKNKLPLKKRSDDEEKKPS